MLDIKFVRSNPELVKENIRKKFQDEKLPLVDEVIALDEQLRAAKTRGDELRALRNTVSREIGGFMKQGLKDKAEEAKKKVAEIADELAALEKQEEESQAELTKRMMVIPNIIDPSVPIGPDDTHNVELEKFGEPVVPDFEVPYHVDIMESLAGIDIDAENIPDMVPALAVTAALCEGVTRITGAERLRIKECDRLAAMTDALTRLGADIRETLLR